MNRGRNNRDRNDRNNERDRNKDCQRSRDSDRGRDRDRSSDRYRQYLQYTLTQRSGKKFNIELNKQVSSVTSFQRMLQGLTTSRWQLSAKS